MDQRLKDFLSAIGLIVTAFAMMTVVAVLMIVFFKLSHKIFR